MECELHSLSGTAYSHGPTVYVSHELNFRCIGTQTWLLDERCVCDACVSATNSDIFAPSLATEHDNHHVLLRCVAPTEERGNAPPSTNADMEKKLADLEATLADTVNRLASLEQKALEQDHKNT